MDPRSYGQRVGNGTCRVKRSYGRRHRFQPAATRCDEPPRRAYWTKRVARRPLTLTAHLEGGLSPGPSSGPSLLSVKSHS